MIKKIIETVTKPSVVASVGLVAATAVAVKVLHDYDTCLECCCDCCEDEEDDAVAAEAEGEPVAPAAPETPAPAAE